MYVFIGNFTISSCRDNVSFYISTNPFDRGVDEVRYVPLPSAFSRHSCHGVYRHGHCIFHAARVSGFYTPYSGTVLEADPRLPSGTRESTANFRLL